MIRKRDGKGICRKLAPFSTDGTGRTSFRHVRNFEKTRQGPVKSPLIIRSVHFSQVGSSQELDMASTTTSQRPWPFGGSSSAGRVRHSPPPTPVVASAAFRAHTAGSFLPEDGDDDVIERIDPSSILTSELLDLTASTDEADDASITSFYRYGTQKKRVLVPNFKVNDVVFVIKSFFGRVEWVVKRRIRNSGSRRRPELPIVFVVVDLSTGLFFSFWRFVDAKWRIISGGLIYYISQSARVD